MIPAEFIVRGYATGSFLEKIKQGKKFISGFQVPEGEINEADKLKKPFFDMTDKAEYGEHDEEINMEYLYDILFEMGVGEPKIIANRIRENCIKAYAAAAAKAAEAPKAE